MSKNNLFTIRQPYEIVETLEETITRYFNPDRNESTIYDTNIPRTNRTQSQQTKDNCRWSQKTPSVDNMQQNYSNPKIILKNCQFQELYERFIKLRSVMSDITQRFKEISVMNTQADNVSPPRNSDAQNDLNLGNLRKRNEQEIPEINIRLEDYEVAQVVSSMTCLFPKKSLTKFPENLNVNVVNGQRNQPQINPSTPKLVKVHPIHDSGRKHVATDVTSSYPYKSHCYSKRTDTTLLKKSKKLLITLIDKEIQKAESGKCKSNNLKKSKVNANTLNCMQLKLECIEKIHDELNVLKNLECLKC